MVELHEWDRLVVEVGLVEREVHAGRVREEQALEALDAGGVEERTERPAFWILAVVARHRLARDREQLAALEHRRAFRRLARDLELRRIGAAAFSRLVLAAAAALRELDPDLVDRVLAHR